MSRKIVIDSEQAGRRADIVATELLPTLSRSYVHQLMTLEKISVNDKQTKAGQKLQRGDILRISFEPEELEQIPDIELPILYEDKNVIVINKPAGIISHSRGKYWYEPSVASFIRQKTGQEGDRTGIVHRLDRATSGVMICAKNQETLSFLQKQFAARKVKKSYIAIVSGHLKDAHAVIDMPVERNPKQPQMFRVGMNGKTARTEYEVTRTYANHDKLLLKPSTGRTHQLRVHLKQVGHPIVGDTLYGKEPYERLLLHAHSLKITLPDSERHTFTAPEPEELERFSDESR